MSPMMVASGEFVGWFPRQLPAVDSISLNVYVAAPFSVGPLILKWSVIVGQPVHATIKQNECLVILRIIDTVI